MICRDDIELRWRLLMCENELLLLLLLLKLFDKLTVEGQTPTSGAAYYSKIN